MNEKTQIVAGPFHTRRKARKTEREMTRMLDAWVTRDILHPDPPIPGWAKGCRVEKVGLFQWAVVATSYKGH